MILRIIPNIRWTVEKHLFFTSHLYHVNTVHHEKVIFICICRCLHTYADTSISIYPHMHNNLKHWKGHVVKFSKLQMVWWISWGTRSLCCYRERVEKSTEGEVSLHVYMYKKSKLFSIGIWWFIWHFTHLLTNTALSSTQSPQKSVILTLGWKDLHIFIHKDVIIVNAYIHTCKHT